VDGGVFEWQCLGWSEQRDFYLGQLEFLRRRYSDDKSGI
jgi:hypothetical protein